MLAARRRGMAARSQLAAVLRPPQPHREDHHRHLAVLATHHGGLGMGVMAVAAARAPAVTPAHQLAAASIAPAAGLALAPEARAAAALIRLAQTRVVAAGRAARMPLLVPR